MRALATAVFAFGFATMLAQTALAAESEALTAATDARNRENTEVDKAYKAATRGGDQAPTAKVDPWAVVRPTTSEKKPKHQQP